MDQYVIKTGINKRGQHYLTHSVFVGYFYTEKAKIFDGLEEVKKAMAWGKKDIARSIKNLKLEINRLKKEVAKSGNKSINKILLDKSKEELKQWEAIKLKAIKL